MRVNRFVFLNLPILQPREPSWLNDFASIPFTCALRHPASRREVTAAWAHALSQQGQASLSTAFLFAFQSYASPIGARRTVGKVGDPLQLRGGCLEGAVVHVVRQCGSLARVLRQSTTAWPGTQPVPTHEPLSGGRRNCLPPERHARHDGRHRFGRCLKLRSIAVTSTSSCPERALGLR